MPFSILAIRSPDDVDGAVWPVLACEPGKMMVESEILDGDLVAIVPVVGVTQMTDGKRQGYLHSINADLYVTDSRVVFACQNFDKGAKYMGAGLGAGVALAATGISRALAANRQRGKILAGQLRYQWCRYVGATGMRGRHGSQLVFAFVTPGQEAPHEHLLAMTLAPRGPCALDVAPDIVRRIATHRLTHWPPKKASQQETLKRLRTIGSLKDPGQGNMRQIDMPHYYPVHQQNAYPRESAYFDTPAGQENPATTTGDAGTDIAGAASDSS